MPVAKIVDLLRTRTSNLPPRIEQIVEVESRRATTLQDIMDAVPGYVDLPEYDAALLVWKKSDARDAVEMLGAARDFIAPMDEVKDMAAFETHTQEWIKTLGVATGNVLWPLRIALSGRAVSQSPFELVYALGVPEALKRIEQAIGRLQQTLP